MADNLIHLVAPPTRKVKRPTGPAPTREPESHVFAKRRERMTRNFIKVRGRDSFRRFLDLCNEGQSGQVIANEFGVTRQRVQQWRDAFGYTITAYSIHDDILALARLHEGEE